MGIAPRRERIDGVIAFVAVAAVVALAVAARARRQLERSPDQIACRSCGST